PLEAGSSAPGPHRVALAPGTATKHNFSVGDSIGVAARGPTQQFRISGIARFGTVDSIGGATFAVFQVPVAQQLMGKEGQYDSIFLNATSGTTPDQLVADLKPLLP